MIDKTETFEGTWPFRAQFSNASGFKHHFVDVGHLDGEVLLCLTANSLGAMFIEK